MIAAQEWGAVLRIHLDLETLIAEAGGCWSLCKSGGDVRSMCCVIWHVLLVWKLVAERFCAHEQPGAFVLSFPCLCLPIADESSQQKGEQTSWQNYRALDEIY